MWWRSQIKEPKMISAGDDAFLFVRYMPALVKKGVESCWYRLFHIVLRRGSTSSLSHSHEPYGAASVAPMRFCCVLSLLLRVGSIPTPHLKTFKQLFWTTTWRKNSRKAQWQAQSRYLSHCAFLVSFRYAGSEKTWPNHFISISLALVTLPTVLHR